ncbi:hypothetical protein IFT48_01340 [Pseudomonas fluorescens]|uniref:hypothetical protein n=1 Tax=Pseudomonas TaxID=286 RepID=UPI000F03C02E|nr:MULTISPECIES: hypothetical protein [Pseudomonas]MBD8088618.1 hypothetical protein [Pseudomonas fluorescens]
MNIPFHHLTPAHSDSQWIDCIQDLSQPVIRPFSLSDLTRFQGVGKSNEGMDEPFMYHFRRVLKNRAVKGNWQENMSILLAMMNRLVHDRDAASWVFLNLLHEHRIAGNDKNAWRLAQGLETLEMFAIIASSHHQLGDPGIKRLSDTHIRSALLKVCELCRAPGMSGFDLLPTNKSLFGESPVCQSRGVPGESSYLVDAVPAASYAKAITASLGAQALEGSIIDDLVVATHDLPLSTMQWESVLKSLVDTSDGEKGDFQDRLDRHAPLITWEEMRQHKWNKYSPISSDDLEYVYDLETITLPDVMKVGEDVRDDLMRMASMQYGKLAISRFNAEQVMQLHMDCRGFFEKLPAHDSPLLGLDMFHGGKDPRAVIDRWTDENSDMIAGTLLSRYSGFEKHIPIGPNRLLGVIMLHSPVENPEHWYLYSVIKMSLIALSRAEEFGISLEALSLQTLRVKGDLGNYAVDYTPPVLDEKAVRQLYRLMPANLKGVSAKLFLGLRISRQELLQTSPVLRDKAFGADMGL